jgi:23S rRNA (pseudouridine1915-N3)-methyltransferase
VEVRQAIGTFGTGKDKTNCGTKCGEKAGLENASHGFTDSTDTEEKESILANPRLGFLGVFRGPLWLNPDVKLRIAWVGKTKESAIQLLTDEYLKRLSRCVDVQGTALKDESALLTLCGPDARPPKHTLVLLDSRGKQLSSEEFAEFLGNHRDRNPLPLLFAVGPANGFTAETRKEANLLLSLGKMTVAHELARVVLLEQLYRAFTILKGHPYHLGH